MRLLAALSVLILVMAVACSGGGGEVTVEEYFRLTDELSRVKERQQAEIEAGDSLAVYQALAQLQKDYRAGLSNVQPPEELRAMHMELLASSEKWLTLLDTMTDLLSKEDPPADLDKVLEPMSAEFDEAESRRREACRALNEFAIENRVSYGDPCAQVFLVTGGSMRPTAENGDLLDVYPYRNERPQRGDIVVFNAPTNRSRVFVNRIIGMPGETLVIDETTGGVRVDGDLLKEPYITGRTTCHQNNCAFVIPELGTGDESALCLSAACYFVMGDNRQNSSDSRRGWYLAEEHVIGWAIAP